MLGSSQSKILKALLYSQEAMNIDGLALRLGISRNATYQHVKSLDRDGLVEKHEIERTSGRPGQTYRLTREGRATFSQSYSLIATLLVGILKQKQGEERTSSIMKELGQSLAKGVAEDLATLPLAEKVDRISVVMKSLGYETVLDTQTDPQDSTPQIIAHNCIFHDVAEEHPEVCDLDISLLENLSGSKVEHSECIVRGGGRCRFRFS